MFSILNEVSSIWKSHYNHFIIKLKGERKTVARRLNIFLSQASIISSILMRTVPMPLFLWHAFELVHYRLKPARLLDCLLLFFCLTVLPGSSGEMKSVPADICETEGCTECTSSKSPARPYFRTALARSVYSKIMVDEEFKKFDRSKVSILIPITAAPRHYEAQHFWLMWDESSTNTHPIEINKEKKKENREVTENGESVMGSVVNET